MDHKQYIIEALDVLRKKETQDKNVFKARAYAKVISELRAYEGAVREMSDIANIPGVGASIRDKIKEILETGQLKAAEVVKADVTVNIREALLKIYGVGPVKAAALITDHHVKSIAHLRELYASDPSILNDKQAVGLKYYEDINARIPRTEMESHKTLLMKAIRAAHPEFVAEIVGSYRRGATDSGDIDMLVTLPDSVGESQKKAAFNNLVTRLTADGYLVEALAKGPTKFMGICKLQEPNAAGRRLDILMTGAHEYPYAVLYFTGSDKFNMAMRKHALGMGYTMNEHTMKPTSDAAQPPVMHTEKDIFDFLKLAYVAPEHRSDGKAVREKNIL